MMKTKLALGISLAALILPSLAFARSLPINSNVWNPGILKGPLVTCTGMGTASTTLSDGTQIPAIPPCEDLCDFVSTSANAVYFGIGAVIWIITPILFLLSGILFMISRGSPERTGQAKKMITGTVIGLLIVVCAYIIVYTFVYILGVSAQIGGFGGPGCSVLPAATQPPSPSSPPAATTGGLALLNNCIPATNNFISHLGTCKNCFNSPGVTAVVSCINNGTKVAGTISATFNGQHTCNVGTQSVSCHFGGLSCSDGAHAFDLGGNALNAAGVGWDQAIAIAQGCGASTNNSVSCRCESALYSPVACTDPSAHHVHCNVNTAICRCP